MTMCGVTPKFLHSALQSHVSSKTHEHAQPEQSLPSVTKDGFK